MYRIENLKMQEDNKTRKIIREYPEYDPDLIDSSVADLLPTSLSDDYLGEKRSTDKSKESDLPEDSFEDLSEDTLEDMSEDTLKDLSEDSPEMSKGFDRSNGSDSSERYISLSYNVIDMIRLAIAACLSFGLTYLMYYASVYSVIILCTILITTMISIELGNDQYNDYLLNIPMND